MMGACGIKKSIRKALCAQMHPSVQAMFGGNAGGWRRRNDEKIF